MMCSWLLFGDDDMLGPGNGAIPGNVQPEGDLGTGVETALRCSGTEFERESRGEVERFIRLGSTSNVGKFISSFSSSRMSFTGDLLRLCADDFISNPKESSTDWPNPAMWPCDLDFFFMLGNLNTLVFDFP